MTIGIHDFAIPHDKVTPTRDMVVLRMPRPPETVGDRVKFIVPQQTRDLAQHNTQAGRIIRMGAMAFAEKHDDGVKKIRVELPDGSVRDPQIGDWAVIRPFAGTFLQGGAVAVTSGWRYVSSFNDVIAVFPPEFGPDPATLLWDEAPSQQHVEGGAIDPAAEAAKATQAAFSFDNKRDV